MLKTTKSKSEFKLPLGSSEKNDQTATHGSAGSSPYEHTMIYEYLSTYRQKDQIEPLVRKISKLATEQQDPFANDSGLTSKY